jgi:hypothetical protein
VAQAEPVQGGAGTLVDVPVVADGGELLLGGLTPLDGAQRPARPRDAEHLVDREVASSVRSCRR